MPVINRDASATDAPIKLYKNTRYFFNTKTLQFIQISNTTLEKPFDSDWVEITKRQFNNLCNESAMKKSL